ncbi:DUF2254 family protein [Isoptericola sp. F-RaC21]|uniref:DUF2254 family protein n=1 Tax=Isoptericola sp. F-RaC21 TaxID=3141452 RepID=UPI00315BECEB
MTLGIGVIGVVSLVYTLLFGVVQWSAGAFSPRLPIFRGDALVWRTFGSAIGVFVFCTVAAVAGTDLPRVSVLVPVVAILGVLTTIALIRQLQTRAFLSIQLAYVLEVVAARGRRVIDRLYPPRPGTHDEGPAEPPAELPPPVRTIVWAGRHGVVQQLDLRQLVEAASRVDGVVHFRVAVGDTIVEGTPLAAVVRGDLPDDLVRRAVVRGRERSFDQDPMFAFRLLADIGLRALSTAVNDPATAVDALDTTDELLQHLATRDLTAVEVHDASGEVRARLVVPAWSDYLRTAVTDLLPTARASPMVLRRMLLLLDHLAEAARSVDRARLEPIRDEVLSALGGPGRRG